MLEYLWPAYEGLGFLGDEHVTIVWSGWNPDDAPCVGTWDSGDHHVTRELMHYDGLGGFWEPGCGEYIDHAKDIRMAGEEFFPDALGSRDTALRIAYELGLAQQRGGVEMAPGYYQMPDGSAWSVV